MKVARPQMRSRHLQVWNAMLDRIISVLPRHNGISEWHNRIYLKSISLRTHLSASYGQVHSPAGLMPSN